MSFFSVYPTLATVQTKRFMELIKSYQNRQNVGTAVLWGLGQCGRKDLAAGLKIWIEYMRPLIRLRHYSRFVVNYLSGLLEAHSASINSGNWAKGPRILYPSQFFMLFDAIFTEASTLPKELQASLFNQYHTIKKLAIGDCSADHELFPEFLRSLDDFLVLQHGASSYKHELLTCLSQCIANNPEACISHWQQMYQAHLNPSATLLHYLNECWSSTLMKSKHFDNPTNLENVKDLLEAFNGYNVNCSAQREGLKEASTACNSLLKKVASKLNRATGGWFPWKISSLFLILGIAVMINKDVTAKGSFKKSNTGLFLQDIGMYNQGVYCFDSVVTVYHLGKDWTQNDLPIYYQTAKTNVEPFMKVAIEKLHKTIAKMKKLVQTLVEKSNHYLPGIKEKLVLASNEALRTGKEALAWAAKTAALVRDWLIFYGEFIVQYAKEVFQDTKQCINDVIEGKIDLTDVYNGAQKILQKSLVHAEKMYEYTRDAISNLMN